LLFRPPLNWGIIESMKFKFSGKRLDLLQPQVMGILNVTPDSFSDGGRFNRFDDAIRQARQMVTDGAAIIDIGGESTRPGAAAVSLDEELNRVIPVIEALVREIEVPLSIDTSKPEVMAAAITAGAGMINDVSALRLPGALEQAANLNVPLCLMHMQGEPRTMQQQPTYLDVVEEVYTFLQQRIEVCVAAGIVRENIVVDPGFGFGKSLGHNLQLLNQLTRFQELGVPILVGLSRKSMIGQLTQREVAERLAGSIAAATLASWLGASIIRVHDVKETVDAVAIAAATRNFKSYQGA
jgi:dihydropteroate synthase